MLIALIVNDSLYISTSLATIFILVLLVLLVYMFIQLRKSRAKQEKMEQLFQKYESSYNKLHLENLESKLNPHLFKNILNSIQSHAYQTYFAMDKLGNVLDYILYESRDRYVTPREEIDFALNLVEINKIKISPLFELKVKTKIEEEDALFEQHLLAPLVSVDLIENAFKHADLQSPNAFISIVFEFRDGVFSMTVTNKISSKNPLKKEKGGVGSATFEERLKIIYKEDFKLERHTENDIYIANLKINLREYKTKMLAAG
ncbi:histidine kinase [Crocinitomicaceae bacterium CZZ-1]|uniref:Histidine kinase n=1 Tax=Taishania pollutisoli TaxID=2766479 RepID=A0A8J6P9I9_9FLAO|nr:histidine kinase [Taishania pollutisoli]MBC9812721.1 histidine kinase [Taishania pollutisoli]MBX2949123.1 histidine kinase [Crocinitomicaceae bacterium]NGF75945.1 histidine kinase [Fluviicola sp. SGL-29]